VYASLLLPLVVVAAPFPARFFFHARHAPGTTRRASGRGKKLVGRRLSGINRACIAPWAKQRDARPGQDGGKGSSGANVSQSYLYFPPPRANMPFLLPPSLRDISLSLRLTADSALLCMRRSTERDDGGEKGKEREREGKEKQKKRPQSLAVTSADVGNGRPAPRHVVSAKGKSKPDSTSDDREALRP